MSVVVALAVLVLAAVAVVLGASLDLPLAAAWTGVLVVSILGVIGYDERRRLRRLADQVSGWLGDRGFAPLEVRRDDAWRQLGVAVNALGAAYERRGARLARERPWRRELVDALVNPALLFSNRSRLLAANDPARALLGIPVGAEELTVVQAVGSGALVGAVAEVEATGEPVTVDAEHRDRNLRATATRVGDETLLIVTDRTRERQIEELRRDFVVNASHELKTPVTSIKTLSEALAVTAHRDEPDPDQLRRLVGRLEKETERLARLVDDLLDLRRLEERGPHERVPVDLAELTRQVVVGLLDRAEAAGVEVAVEAPDRAVVAGVPGDLEVIVKNLVTNAVKYNRRGGEVAVVITPREGHQVLTVRDTGIGIPQQDLGRVFERFYRVDTARSRESGGTGLGLSIVRHAVEGHGGTIGVDSLLGEGTTFTVTLPIGPREG